MNRPPKTSSSSFAEWRCPAFSVITTASMSSSPCAGSPRSTRRSAGIRQAVGDESCGNGYDLGVVHNLAAVGVEYLTEGGR